LVGGGVPQPDAGGEATMKDVEVRLQLLRGVMRGHHAGSETRRGEGAMAILSMSISAEFGTPQAFLSSLSPP
jgi:hypothetical protein